MLILDPDSVTDLRLANGLRAIVRENPDSPSVVLTGVLPGGALLEPDDRPGLAGFAMDLLDRGTRRHTFAELSDELEGLSAEVHFGAGRHNTSLGAHCMWEDLPRVLELATEMLSSATFDAHQVEIVRGQILTDLQQRDDDPRQRAAMAFHELAYGPDHPYGRDLDGTSESIGGTSAADLADFASRALHPRDGVLVVVGGADAGATIAALTATLGSWAPDSPPPIRPPVPEAAPLPGRRTTRVDMPGKVQCNICLGMPAIPRRHPDWLAAWLGNAVLGVFGMMGRLGSEVRDRQGLAYYVYSRLSGGPGPGPWYAAAGVNPADAERAVSAMFEEMHRLRTDLVGEEELADVRAFATGSLPLRLETNGGMASQLMEMALYDLGLDYLERYPGLVAGIGPEDVRRAAVAHLDVDRAAIAIAGPPCP